MLNLEKVKEELNKRNFSYKNNIVPGHSTYKVKWILPAGASNRNCIRKSNIILIWF